MQFKIVSQQGKLYLWRKFIIWWPVYTWADQGSIKVLCRVKSDNLKTLIKHCDAKAAEKGYRHDYFACIDEGYCCVYKK